MNERILEIAEQSGAKVSTLGGVFVDKRNMDIEKFAELIVRECALLVQGVPVDTLGYRTADQEIKQHFGVDK